MATDSPYSKSPLPSVDRIVQDESAKRLVETFGRDSVIAAIRRELTAFRERGDRAEADTVLNKVARRLSRDFAPSLRRVLNLTGTVLHTNLGRAVLPEEAIAAASDALRQPTNLEFDLARGQRGERDDHLRSWLIRLTGAEDATVVNNNAAAVLLVLNALALKREVVVSRGELVEIGGSFRIPDIMARAGCKLVEVGTTNRTHLKDYEAAIGPKTGLVMSVHPSNYAIVGFTTSVAQKDLGTLASKRGIPYVIDLGSGSLVDFERFGLPHEPTPRDMLAAGADVVTFSGDKLLGGPQAGIIVGRADLLRKINKNPLKRALRVDKGRIAALEAVLRIYADPLRLSLRLPTFYMLTRSVEKIRALGARLLPIVQAKLGEGFDAELQPCDSQIGSGSLPVDRLPSYCLALRYRGQVRGGAANRLAAALRSLSIPIIGRVEDGWVKLDLRCLDDENELLSVIGTLSGSERA